MNKILNSMFKQKISTREYNQFIKTSIDKPDKSIDWSHYRHDYFKHYVIQRAYCFGRKV